MYSLHDAAQETFPMLLLLFNLSFNAIQALPEMHDVLLWSWRALTRASLAAALQAV
jgi:hypothetical protein